MFFGQKCRVPLKLTELLRLCEKWSSGPVRMNILIRHCQCCHHGRPQNFSTFARFGALWGGFIYNMQLYCICMSFAIKSAICKKKTFLNISRGGQLHTALPAGDHDRVSCIILHDSPGQYSSLLFTHVSED